MFYLVGYNLDNSVPEGGYVIRHLFGLTKLRLKQVIRCIRLLFQALFVCATVSIVSGAVAERIKICLLHFCEF